MPSRTLLKLSVVTQGVVDSIEAAEPGAPTNGDVVILDEAHATHANEIAVRDDGAWVYIEPVEGWMFFNTDDGQFYRLEGGVWTVFMSGTGPAETETISGATYTLVLADASNKYIRLTNVAGCEVTVPPNADVAIPVDTVITFRNASAGISSLVAGVGVTLNPPGGSGGSLDFAEEGATVQIKKVATDQWDIIGGTAA
jgi:hypothetical protein